ncbi:MAG: glycerol-3-phosphate 1-O-acyltransferase PlsY [Betaproteobacteria bacterium]|nr:MAG: glycerol-3-phosphate 1-O-acyltransferase PlsY [Betaproteobacteria bacterium]
MQTALIALAAYLLGSISFAIVVSRAMRLPDPRGYGSGNPGATNVLRSGSRTAAALTLAGDAAKGWLAVWLTVLYTGQAPAAGLEAPLAGLCAFLGHLYPVFHRFRGGKGVATAVGVVIGIDAWLGLATLASFGVVAAFFRMASLASIVAAVFAAFYTYWLFGLRPVTAAVAVIVVLLVVRHRDNIGRLLRGEERRIGEKKA